MTAAARPLSDRDRETATLSARYRTNGGKRMTEGVEREADPGNRQTTGLHSIGHALRSTYDAENHDSLGQEITGLMLHLARVDDAPAPAQPAVAETAPPPRSWLTKVFGR